MTLLQLQRLLISPWGMSSVSRNGGEPDLRFDEGTKGNDVLFWASGQMLKEHWRVSNTEFTNIAVMHRGSTLLSVIKYGKGFRTK